MRVGVGRGVEHDSGGRGMYAARRTPHPSSGVEKADRGEKKQVEQNHKLCVVGRTIKVQQTISARWGRRSRLSGRLEETGGGTGPEFLSIGDVENKVHVWAQPPTVGAPPENPMSRVNVDTPGGVCAKRLAASPSANLRCCVRLLFRFRTFPRALRRGINVVTLGSVEDESARALEM